MFPKILHVWECPDVFEPKKQLSLQNSEKYLIPLVLTAVEKSLTDSLLCSFVGKDFFFHHLSMSTNICQFILVLSFPLHLASIWWVLLSSKVSHELQLKKAFFLYYVWLLLPVPLFWRLHLKLLFLNSSFKPLLSVIFSHHFHSFCNISVHFGGDPLSLSCSPLRSSWYDIT